MFENMPPPQFGPCLVLNWGGGGGLFSDDTVYLDTYKFFFRFLRVVYKLFRLLCNDLIGQNVTTMVQVV